MRKLTLRATPAGGAEAGALTPVEVGNAVRFAGGFAIGVLRGGSVTRAQIEWFDGKGRERRVDLGVVHGAVEPPHLLSVDKKLIVGLTDNDAGHSTIRIASVSPKGAEFAVAWGPSIQRMRSDSQEFSLAAGLSGDGKNTRNVVTLAWDARERTSLRSTIHALSFALESLKITASERVLTPLTADAVAPLLLPRESGLWLLWTEYGELPPRSSASLLEEGLVEEGARTLWVQAIGLGLRSESAPLSLSKAKAHVVAFDGIAMGSGGLLVAFREGPGGRPIGASPILTSFVQADGSVQPREIEQGSLGPGAPMIMTSETDLPPWLVARGVEEQVLLGLIDEDGAISRFFEEPGLNGHIPIQRLGVQLLTMRPLGLDLELGLSECHF